MIRACVFDLGFNAGYGVLARDYVRSGTHRLDGSWNKMGLAFRTLNKTVRRVVEMHEPTDLGACRPFVSTRRDPNTGKFVVNHMNMIPMMGFYAKLQEIADELGLPFHDIYESDARKAFLSPSPIPRKSEDIKRAVMAACALRGWPTIDSHSADALCACDLLLAQLDKGSGWNRLPLFLNTNGKSVTRNRNLRYKPTR